MAGIICAALATSQTAAIASPTVPVAVPAPAPVSAAEETGGKQIQQGTGPELGAAQLCYFYDRWDNVHVSGSDASGHGWWENIDCSATQAWVTVQLQQYYSDGSWRNVGTPGRKKVYSGGGSANRAVGRATCNSSAYTGWRSVIDTDLIGQADDPGKSTSPSHNLYCRH